MGCVCNGPGECPYLGNVTAGLWAHCRTRSPLVEKVARHRGRSLPPDDGDRVGCAFSGGLVGVLTSPVGSLDVIQCNHPSHGYSTASGCAGCPDCRQVDPASPSLFSQLLPSPQKGPVVTRWAVGVVTAPRSIPTLGPCLDSVLAAGFSPRIFAEPDSPIEERHRGLPITQRDQVASAWGNWYLALHEMMMREPKADAYLIAQDDVVLSSRDSVETLREFLSRSLWPDEKAGLVSLYCSSAYDRESFGWHEKPGNWRWGACAFVWRPEALRSFLSSVALDWTLQGNTRLVDSAVGVWARKKSRPVWYCFPSLCQHIGQASTIWGGRQTAWGKRAASTVAGSLLGDQ